MAYWARALAGYCIFLLTCVTVFLAPLGLLVFVALAAKDQEYYDEDKESEDVIKL